MVISGVTNLLAGTTQVVRAYAGSTEVWNPTPPTPTGIPADEIWYTTVSGQVEDLSTACTLTGMTIVSNTYNDGKGVMKFSAALTELPDMAFYYSPTLVSVELPPQVTVLGTEAFRDCKQLTAVTLNSDLTTIGEGTFRGSTIQSFVIPDSVTSLGDYAFRYCQSLTALTIGSGITSIGYQVFQKCDILPSITIPDSVTTIGTQAFASCEALSSITIPTGVTQIGASAFTYCKNLVEIKYDGTKDEWPGITRGKSWNWDTPSYGVYCSDGYVTLVTLSSDSSKTLYYTTTTKSTISPINESAFNDTYSNSITSNSYSTNTARGTIRFYYEITTIPVNAFSGMTSLESICINNEGAKIGNYAFKDCTNLISITYLGTKSNWNSKTKGTDWHLNAKATVVHCTDGDVSI